MHSIAGNFILQQGNPSCQINYVRCPGHTIQFLNYAYTQYIKKY